MTREILNLEAELIQDEDEDGYGESWFIVVTINGHELYRFPAERVYSIQEKGLSLTEVLIDHLRKIAEEDK